MAHLRLIPTVALLAALWTAAVAEPPAPLMPLAEAVAGRRAQIDVTTRAGRKQLGAVDAAESALSEDLAWLDDRLLAVQRCAKRLDRAFPFDAEFGPLLHDAIFSLGFDALADRDRLAELAEDLELPRDRKRAEKGVAAFDRRAARAAVTFRRAGAARHLRKGWKKVRRAELAIGVGPLRAFSLPDVNPNSATFEQEVSARDELGRISAWYFGHST